MLRCRSGVTPRTGVPGITCVIDIGLMPRCALERIDMPRSRSAHLRASTRVNRGPPFASIYRARSRK